jgi:hypothetical protein
MEDRRIAVKIEFSYAGTYFNEGTDLTDAELRTSAVNDFITDITRLYERGDLWDYVYSSINDGVFTLSKAQKSVTTGA